MSTKSSISYSQDSHHLYQEGLDNRNVYLCLTDVEDLGLTQLLMDGKPTCSVTVAIPVKTWRAMIVDWQESAWGKAPELDYTHQITSDFLKNK